MQRHHGEARDGGYIMVPLHVASDDWWRRLWRMKLSIVEELATKAKNGSFGNCPRLFFSKGGWSELKDGGYSGREAMHSGQGGS